jgi:hypothetical protein
MAGLPGRDRGPRNASVITRPTAGWVISRRPASWAASTRWPLAFVG